MAGTDLIRDKGTVSTQTTDSFVDISELSAEETKHFLTPFAFRMDKSLFGLPLASPTKRAIALLIDLGLIALLSGITGVVLAFAIAITLYRLGSKQRAQARGKIKGAKRRAFMRFIGALVLFIILLDTLPKLLTFAGIESKNAVINVEDNPISFKSSVALTGFAVSTMSTIADSDCKQLECWKNELRPIVINMAKIKANGIVDAKSEEVTGIFIKISEKTKLNSVGQAELIEFMLTVYQLELTTFSPEIAIEQASQLLAEEQKPAKNSYKQEAPNKPIYSVIELIKGIIIDLGLGFGWATFYFTVFIALGHGQTIGKKVLGIKVLQLDGTPLSLWDSFGRYGGYGAGIATGLLGFIQIYWDPNRQAIHDKISATIVIDVNKTRLTLNTQGNIQAT